MMAILKFYQKIVLGEVKGSDPDLSASSLYISVAIKASLLKFNMFNIIIQKQYF